MEYENIMLDITAKHHNLPKAIITGLIPIIKNCTRGYFTLNENLEHINLISNEEVLKRTKEFLKKHHQ